MNKLASHLEQAAQPTLLHWHGEAGEQEPSWLIKNLLQTVGTALMVAPSQYGKSFVLLDLAYSVMLKKQTTFAGRRVVRHGGVLWIAAEAPGSLPIRLRGLETKMGGANLFSEQPTLPFCWCSTLPPLLKGGDKEISAIAQVAAAELQQRFGVELVLIIVDTLAKAGGWESENSASETGEVLRIAEQLSQERQSLVILSDHPGKDVTKGARGSSAKMPAVDTELDIYADRRDETSPIENRRLFVRKQRDGQDGVLVPFRLQTVELGKDRDGDAVTTCFVEWEPNRTVTFIKPARNKASPRTRDTLRDAIDQAGGLPAKVEQVRGAFKKLHGGKNRAPDMAWKRALEAAKHLEVRDGILQPKPEVF